MHAGHQALPLAVAASATHQGNHMLVRAAQLLSQLNSAEQKLEQLALRLTTMQQAIQDGDKKQPATRQPIPARPTMHMHPGNTDHNVLKDAGLQEHVPVAPTASPGTAANVDSTPRADVAGGAQQPFLHPTSPLPTPSMDTCSSRQHSASSGSPPHYCAQQDKDQEDTRSVEVQAASVLRGSGKSSCHEPVQEAAAVKPASKPAWDILRSVWVYKFCTRCWRSGHDRDRCWHAGSNCKVCRRSGNTTQSCRHVKPSDHCDLCGKCAHNTKGCFLLRPELAPKAIRGSIFRDHDVLKELGAIKLRGTRWEPAAASELERIRKEVDGDGSGHDQQCGITNCTPSKHSRSRSRSCSKGTDSCSRRSKDKWHGSRSRSRGRGMDHRRGSSSSSRGRQTNQVADRARSRSRSRGSPKATSRRRSSSICNRSREPSRDVTRGRACSRDKAPSKHLQLARGRSNSRGRVGPRDHSHDRMATWKDAKHKDTDTADQQPAACQPPNTDKHLVVRGPASANKKQYCSLCKSCSHDTDQCWTLDPVLAPAAERQDVLKRQAELVRQGLIAPCGVSWDGAPVYRPAAGTQKQQRKGE